MKSNSSLIGKVTKMQFNETLMSSSRKKVFKKSIDRWSGSTVFRVVAFIAAIPVFIVIVPIFFVLSPIIFAWDFAGAITERQHKQSINFPWDLDFSKNDGSKWDNFFIRFNNIGDDYNG